MNTMKISFKFLSLKALLVCLFTTATVASYGGNLVSGGSYNSHGCIECLNLTIGDSFVLNGDTMIVADRVILDSLIAGNHDLTKACVSHVTDMSGLFQYTGPLNNQDIKTWDVSNVTNMLGMFTRCVFNHPINNWDVSNVTTMS